MLQTPSTDKPHGSVALSAGVRVAVQPKYLPEQSDPGARQWLFTYRIRISNESAQRVQLMTRHWVIVDSSGQREEVRGPGVVGQQPMLAPGQVFEYSSFVPLRTSWGTMEGAYQFVGEDGSNFEAQIARFYLVSGDR
ncbi:MAG: Co2+/Mg2+ efflux protein ApaG [Phycisphaerales bacterium]|nr:Co2+/Mg2+ efflux protein ApaG [Phycisphaerales bacterium]